MAFKGELKQNRMDAIGELRQKRIKSNQVESKIPLRKTKLNQDRMISIGD